MAVTHSRRLGHVASKNSKLMCSKSFRSISALEEPHCLQSMAVTLFGTPHLCPPWIKDGCVVTVSRSIPCLWTPILPTLKGWKLLMKSRTLLIDCLISSIFESLKTFQVQNVQIATCHESLRMSLWNVRSLTMIEPKIGLPDPSPSLPVTLNCKTAQDMFPINLLSYQFDWGMVCLHLDHPPGSTIVPRVQVNSNSNAFRGFTS